MCGKVFNIGKDSRTAVYRSGVASLINNFFDKKLFRFGGAVMSEGITNEQVSGWTTQTNHWKYLLLLIPFRVLVLLTYN